MSWKSTRGGMFLKDFIYRNEKLKEISFPIGGIGSGCVGIAGNGRFIDWEIQNRPNKESVNDISHFAIKAEKDGKVIDVRVLNGDLLPPYSGNQNFGFGPKGETMAGMPHFRNVEFKGEFPFAELTFWDENFPGRVKLKAFNPFIPLNDKDSSIPAAFFEVEVENNTDSQIKFTVVLSVANPNEMGTHVNVFKTIDGISLITQTTNKYMKTELKYGETCIATDATDISYQEYFYRGNWFDKLTMFWKDFSSFGKLKNRQYPLEPGKNEHAKDLSALAASVDVNPNKSSKVKFILTWNFPNASNYWNPPKCDSDSCCCTVEQENLWKNYYATVFENASDSAIYSLKEWNRLHDETLLFKNTLFNSTLPHEVIDAISANISILKSPTSLRLEDGSFYGFEGCSCQSGCCDGSCTHVWNYAYALPFLFPKLERSMRNLDYQYNMIGEGLMSFRLQLPIRQQTWELPCADGQMGGVIKVYREWKISGDSEWLKKIWPSVKKTLEFAWADTNKFNWDPGKAGVLSGRQHHTLDMELFGPNSWLTGFYLAALKAGAEISEFLDQHEDAKEYMEIFEKGKAFADSKLFNGEYYHQLIDLKDEQILEPYKDDQPLIGDSVAKVYWNAEAKEIKYQIGEGCGIDQVLAQWHANLCGLGEIFDKAQTKSALKSIYKYNHKKTMRNFVNPCRLYCLNDEAGTLICSWPQGKVKPVITVPYAEETMHGFEYQFASHMIQEGMLEEGLEIVKAVRDRYDGEKRNPWNEIECGSNYARSMASYSLLNSYSGFQFDMIKGEISFNPVLFVSGKFECFWSIESAWGNLIITPENAELKILWTDGSSKIKKGSSLFAKKENNKYKFNLKGND